MLVVSVSSCAVSAWICRWRSTLVSSSCGARRGDEFPLRPEVVGQQPPQRPFLVQRLQLGGNVVAVVSDHLPHDVPVLLLDASAVILVHRPAPGERHLVPLAPAKQLPVDELRCVARVDSQDRERDEAVRSLIAANTHFWAVFLTGRVSVQPVTMSVTSRVNQNSPLLLPPSWPTKSISTNPGPASFPSAQVSTGIESFSSTPAWYGSCRTRSASPDPQPVADRSSPGRSATTMRPRRRRS